MKRGRSGHLIRTIILLVAVVVAFIVVSAAIRYNRKSGLFDAHKQKPQEHAPVSKTAKPGGSDPNLPTSTVHPASRP